LLAEITNFQCGTSGRWNIVHCFVLPKSGVFQVLFQNFNAQLMCFTNTPSGALSKHQT